MLRCFVAVCPQLDELRDIHDTIDSRLAQISERDRDTLLALRSPIMSDDLAASLTYKYMPQIGFVAVLAIEPDQSPPMDLEGFDFRFRTETHGFYKNETAEQLDSGQ